MAARRWEWREPRLRWTQAIERMRTVHETMLDR